MPELELLLRHDTRTGSRGPLLARAADVAERVARVVERLDSADPAAGTTLAFLADWVATARRSAGPSGPTDPPTPLDRLVRALGLGGPDVDLLLLAGLAEEHEGLAGTYRALHPLGEPHATVGLAALVLDERDVDRAGLRRILHEGPLRRLGILRLTGAGHGPERSLVLADALWEVLHGVDATPAALRRVVLGPAPDGLERWCEEPLAARAGRLVRDRAAVSVVVSADEEHVAADRCAALLARVGATGYGVRIGPRDDATTVATAVLHAAARDAVPVFLLPSPPRGEDPATAPTPDAVTTAAPLVDALAEVPVPVLVGTAGRWGDVASARPLLVLHAGPVDPASRRAAWRTTRPGTDDDTAAVLADRLPLDPSWVLRVCGDLEAAGLPRTPDEAAAALRRRVGASLPPGTTLVTPRVGWEGLVLPDEPGDLLRDAAARLVHQRTVLEDWAMGPVTKSTGGVRVLLCGVPGTGKSLAAEVLATAVGTDLLRVDLSQVVSKWLGETEKNLGAVFDAAERTRAVLLLDEADALFASRTEVTDSHDRYANLETAYLLQRLEASDGIVVLTTNLRRGIDPAFLRRLDVVVDVPLPEEPSRRRLWDLHLPGGHLAADVDVPVLARMYPVPGASIRNAALGAAYTAAAAGTPVHQQHLISAVRREYAKAALPFPGEPPRRRDDQH